MVVTHFTMANILAAQVCGMCTCMLHVCIHVTYYVHIDCIMCMCVLYCALRGLWEREEGERERERERTSM